MMLCVVLISPWGRRGARMMGAPAGDGVAVRIGN